MQPRRGLERLQGSGVAMHRNRLSRHRRADGYVNVQTQSVHKTCAVLIPTKPQCGDREVGTASPAAKKLIELSFWGREHQFPSTEKHWLRPPPSAAGPVLRVVANTDHTAGVCC